MKEALPAGGELQVLLAGAAGSGESERYGAVSRAVVVVQERREPARSSAPVVGAGTSDSRYFRARGIVAYGIAPFKVNYYDADTVHANDERIRARFFAEGVRLMRTIVSRFLRAPDRARDEAALGVCGDRDLRRSPSSRRR